jgi:[protein-PII] uridylyltransferase
VESLDDLYFLRVNESDCTWHARALAPLDRRETACFVELGKDREAKVAVWSEDREGLFVKICSALARAGLSVRSAKLSSSKSGWALDSFDAEDVRCDQENLANRKDEIERLVVAALAPNASEEKPKMGRCSARARHSGAIAQTHISKTGGDWLVEVACADRAGVLWSIAEELAKRGLAVKSARVSTVGERAEDVFVVEGSGLESPDERRALETALVGRLGL